MADLFDYLHWRGDLTFSQVPPGPVDALIFSALSYLTFRGSVAERPDIPISLREASEEFFTGCDQEDRCRVKVDLSLLMAASETKRFGNALLLQYRDILISEEDTQFAAITFLLDNSSAFLAFRGTDYSLTGWKVEAQFILDLWLKDVPAYAVSFTRIVLAESLFYVLTFGMSTIVNATGKLMRMEVTGRLITIAILPVSYYLLKVGAPIYIPLVVSLVSQVAYATYLFTDVKAKTGITLSRFLKGVIKPVAILAFALTISCGIESMLVEEGFARFLLVGTTTVAVSLGTIWAFCLDSGEKSFVKNFIASKL